MELGVGGRYTTRCMVTESSKGEKGSANFLQGDFVAVGTSERKVGAARAAACIE